MFAKSTQLLAFSGLFVALFAVSLNGQSDDAQLIEWKSTAETSVVAKFVGEDAKKKTITLEKKDSKRVTVPLAKLSSESQKVALSLIREHRQSKNLVGTWHWRCPVKNELEWRIKTTLTRIGQYYRLTENSTGHSQSDDYELSYLYRKQDKIFIAVDKRNNGEKRSPFTIDAKGDRISYHRRLKIGNRVIVPGGDFLEINYANKTDAESWMRKNDSFPSIDIQTR